MKKKSLFLILLCLGMIALGVVVIAGYQWKKAKNQSGVLLAFDDYSPDNWETYFDLFEEYDVKATFFINASEPTDFCANAVARGHEIAFHGAEHKRFTELTDEEVDKYAIAPIQIFKEQGYELTTFAYPYGEYNEELNEKLLEHYKVTRGAYFYSLNPKENLKEGFVESFSIDNVNFESDEDFKSEIDGILNNAALTRGTVVSIYSHAIDGGSWCVSPDRLEYIFQKAEQIGLKFYTFKDLQK